jgi:hypothetical protein
VSVVASLGRVGGRRASWGPGGPGPGPPGHGVALEEGVRVIGRGRCVRRGVAGYMFPDFPDLGGRTVDMEISPTSPTWRGELLAPPFGGEARPRAPQSGKSWKSGNSLGVTSLTTG